jgi:hypothetical protein
MTAAGVDYEPFTVNPVKLCFNHALLLDVLRMPLVSGNS